MTILPDAGGAASAADLDARWADAGRAGVDAANVSDGKTGPLACPTIKLADSALEKVIRAAISLPNGDITPASIAGLTDLKAREAGITSLSGIQCLTSLAWLDIAFNPISDLQPLAGMTWLKSLKMVGTTTGDISALTDLTGLVELIMGFHKTPINGFGVTARMTDLLSVEIYSGDLADISSLANCPEINSLKVSNNLIVDISPVTRMKKLGALRLFSNRISDISPLEKASAGLHSIDLSANRITDIAPLGRWTGNRNAISIDIDISRNPIADLSPLLSLPHTGSVTVYARETKIDCSSQAENLAALRQKQINVFSDCL